MPTLSILIPVWNAERWLTACVDSILRQSYTDFELLLIDDGSTDGSPALCDGFAAADGRVKVLHRANGGPSSARNAGLEQAAGKYITFADSDDELLPGTLEKAVAEMERGQWDVIGFGYTVQLPDRSYDMVCPAFSCRERAGLWPHFEDYYHTTGQFCFVWNKLYRRDVIEQHRLRFDHDKRNGEDICFNFAYFSHIESVCVLDFPGYRYFERKESLSRLSSTDHLDICEKTIGWAKAFFEAADAPAEQLPRFEQAQLLANVSVYYSVLTDSTQPYTLAQRTERLRKIFKSPRYRDTLKPWLAKQQGLQYTYLRAAAALNSPLLSALPVALKASINGGHHA